MKKILSLLMLGAYCSFYSQVGINTVLPDKSAVLDIVSTNKGILLPRVSAYPSSPATGLMVYRTDLNGFYAWNGSIWTQAVFGDNTNIYNTDGSLAGNRIVSQGGNSLSFTGSTINAFSVDGTTFSIDALNNRIGIGTIAPTNALHVSSTTDPLRLQGVASSTNSVDKVLVIDPNGVLKTSISSNSAFSGYISTATLPITSSTTVISKIPVNTELVDSSNEFSISNYTFTPASSGTYEIELQMNVQSAAVGTGQVLSTAPCGLVDQNSGLYVTRWQYPENTLQTTWYFKGVAALTAGNPYYFGFVRGSTTSPNLTINPLATGSTGSGRATYFSIKRIL